MKIILILLVSLAAALVIIAAPKAAPLERGQSYRVSGVFNIVDGDTFDAMVDGSPERIRPMHYDARERHETGGPKATDDLRELLAGAWAIRVDYQQDDRNQWRDPSGTMKPRRIGAVWIKLGLWREWTPLGAEMVHRSMVRRAHGQPETATPWRETRAKSWGRD